MSKLDSLCEQINKDWKEQIASKGIKRIETKKIPFSSPRLNYMTYGGLPRGCLVEFFGEENGGKTTTALDICKNAQKLFYEEWEEELSNTKDEKRKTYLQARGPQVVFYADCENTLDEDWATLLGVDVSKMYIVKPQTQAAEDIFQIVLDAIDTDEVGLAIIDSLGVLMSKQAYEKDMTEKTYGGIAMPLTLFSKKAELLCKKTGCTVLGINQERDNLSSPYGGKITPGGQAWKFNCMCRFGFAKGEYIDEAGNHLNRSCETPAGNKVLVSIAKTKAFKPDRKTGYYTLTYDYGVDSLVDLVEVAMKYDLIHKAGAWFSFVDPETDEVITDEQGTPLKFQGMAALLDFLREDEYMENELTEQVNLRMY